MELSGPVSKVKGIGDKKARLLAKLNIDTIEDLLHHLPRGYESAGMCVRICELADGGAYQVNAVVVEEPKLRRIRNGLNLTTISLSDETGRVEAVFFNQPYIKNMFKPGQTVCVSGSVKRTGRKLQFTNPVMDKNGVPQQGLMPIYPLTAGVTQKAMRLFVRAALDALGGRVSELFPAEFRKSHGLAEINYALEQIHFPTDEASLEQAKHRLIFEELLLFNLALASRETAALKGASICTLEAGQRDCFLLRLGYQPTDAQLRVMDEIERDMRQTKPMNRLLQGDVGSGKTTPAFYAMYICVKNGRQSAMMAPTEVLARQHFENAMNTLADAGVNIELLTGSTPPGRRRVICENIAAGNTHIVIGTHAVLYDHVQFADLGLVITDEQHRFGVGQRALLETKAGIPHTLIMSATPIPRTLALILFGKTDISILDEMPPGRQPVKTFCVPENKRADMYGFFEKELCSGAQVFVVCPLVEESEAMEARSAEQTYESLRSRFPRWTVELLHGRLKPQEKNDVMTRFKAKQTHILVSTTVIEVGVDVPAATIMVIENAERFGLAQLHQLRGRVGRGSSASYCFLMSPDQDNERLTLLAKTNDGFKIAEEDLRLRGPGQFLGSRQSGASDLYMSHLISDMRMLRETRLIAVKLKQNDPALYDNLLSAASQRFEKKLKKTTIN
jgi:ATP-dependent DNA helicase RecG